MNRKGGVALHLDIALTYTVVENEFDTLEDIFECLTVEINAKKKQNKKTFM